MCSSRWRSLATRTRFSLPVRISSTAANCPVRLIDFPDSGTGSVVTSDPATVAVPASCVSSVDRMRIIVVLPALLEPEQGEDAAYGAIVEATPSQDQRAARRRTFRYLWTWMADDMTVAPSSGLSGRAGR